MPSPKSPRSRPERQRHGRSIVLLGSFNPVIFQPTWLSGEGLVRPDEARDAELALIHPDASQFTVSGMGIQALKTRLEIKSTPEIESFDLLRDLALGVLGLLSHTPVSALGVNEFAHYEMPSEEAWDALGAELVPRGRWERCLSRPGVRLLDIEGQREDDYDGFIRVRLEPSQEIPHGVYVQVNSHYQLTTNGYVPAGDLIDLLPEAWADSATRTASVVKSVFFEQ